MTDTDSGTMSPIANDQYPKGYLWLAELDGHSRDLTLLTDLLQSHDTHIVLHGTRFYLHSNSWEILSSDRDVNARAEQLLSTILSIFKMRLKLLQPVTIARIVDLRSEEPRRYVWFHIAPKNWKRSKYLADQMAAAESLGAQKLSQHKRHLSTLLASVEVKPAAHNVLRLWSEGDWRQLYAAFEIIEHDVGNSSTLLSLRWISRNQLNRFKRTANSPHILGLEARHGASMTVPPRDPMSADEAKIFIAKLIQRWLCHQNSKDDGLH